MEEELKVVHQQHPITFLNVKEKILGELVNVGDAVSKMTVNETHSSGPMKLIGRVEKLLPETMLYQGK